MLLHDLFHFEMPDMGGGPAPVEPMLAPAEPAASAEPAEPAWSGPSQEEWQAATQRLAYYDQMLQEPEEQEQQEQIPEIDFFADDASSQMFQMVRQAIQQELAPYQEWQQSQQLGEAEERALDILQDIVSRDGEFVEQDRTFKLIRDRANEFMPEASQRYGFGPKAAEVALGKAAAEMREYQEAVGKAYYERQMNQLTSLSGARREPGIAGTGAQQLVTNPGGDELDLVRRYTGVAGR